MRKILFFILPGLLALSCSSFRAYYNTFYLAQKTFQAAEDNRLKTKGDKLSPTTKQLYQEAVTKASRLLTFYPRSKYVDDALLIIGKSYYYQEDYSKAERKFQEIRAGFPKSDLLVEADYFSGLAFLKMGRFEDAAAAWGMVLENRKGDKFQREALYSLAGLKFELEEYGQAIELYQKFLSKHKKDSKAGLVQKQIAESFWEMKDYENARKAYLDVKKYTQDKELIYQAEFKAGLTAYELKKTTEGMAIFKHLADNPAYYPHLPEIKLQLAQGLLASGQVEEATKLNEEILAAYPKTVHSAQAYYQLGIIQQDYKEDLKAAKDMFDKAKDEVAGSEVSKKALQRSADISKLEEYRHLLSEGETEKSVETQFLLAEFYLTHLNRPDSALAAYKNIVQKNPQSEYAPKSLLALAYICGNILQDSAGCRQACEELIKNYPSTDYAVQAAKILNRDPLQADSLSAAYLFGRAEEQLFSGQNLDSALKLYQRIIDSFPNSVYVPRALLGKAYILEHSHPISDDSGQRDSTVYLAYQSIIEKAPESEAAAVARLKLGLKEKSLPVLPKPQTQTPADTTRRADTTTSVPADTADTLIMGFPRAPEPLSKGNFVYPPEFIDAQINGFVYLKIEIDYFTGEARKVEVLQGIGNQEIERRVVEAMRVAKFDRQRLYPTYFEGVYGYRFKVQAPKSGNQ